MLPSPEGIPWIVYPSSVVEPVRRLISRIERKEAIPKRLAFVSALRKEGVSFTSRLFGLVLAHDVETSVCIVDLNWRWPSDFYRSVPASGGLGAVLCGAIPLEQAVIPTGISNLVILPAGDIPDRAHSQLAHSGALKDLMQELDARFDHLILDIPAVLACNDAIPLASSGTAGCLVIHHGAATIAEVKSALSDLDHIPILGVVMNKYKISVPGILTKLVSPDTVGLAT